MAELTLQNVARVFPNGVRALEDLSLSVSSGELLTVVGPSGSGKTTMLRLVAGLDNATRGKITLDGREISQLLPRDRHVSMVVQNGALFPHLSVRGNLLFGPEMRGRLGWVPRTVDRWLGRKTALQQTNRREEIQTSIAQNVELLGISGLLDRMPDQLSGGESQRVAIARALVSQPRILLLDEPFHSLDAPLRAELGEQFRHWQSLRNITTIFVTHDQQEAFSLGHRVAILAHGRLIQHAKPEEILATPASPFVTHFLRDVQAAPSSK